MRRPTRPNANRERIYAIVTADPGVHVRRLAPLVGLSWNCCNSHLRLLEHEGRVVSRKVDGKLCWFDSQHQAIHDKSARCVLRDSGHRAVAKSVLASPGSNQVSLARTLRLADSSIHRHLSRLERAGLVERLHTGRSRHVFPTQRLQDLMAPEDANGPLGAGRMHLGGSTSQVAPAGVSFRRT